jgi:Coenzyme PQQ synthesis protein D (PqqD)
MTSALSPQSPNPAARSDVFTEYLADGSVVIFDPLTSVAHELNATGALVWDCCDGTYGFQGIVAALEECFDSPSEMSIATLREDVTYFLQVLQQKNLLISPPSL